MWAKIISNSEEIVNSISLKFDTTIDHDTAVVQRIYKIKSQKSRT